MRRKWKFYVCLIFVFVLLMGFQSSAAGAVTISSCVIQGSNVVVTASGNAAGDDGNYYLFSLQPYEKGIGARTDYCGVSPIAGAVNITAPLDLDTLSSRLYARFVVAVKQGGKYVPISNEFYITNPEAVAKHTINAPAGSKKGLTMDGNYNADLTDLGCGYALYELDLKRFYNGGGVDYIYNGKNYSFNALTVNEYDFVMSLGKKNNVHMIMAIKLGYDPMTVDLIRPGARKAGMRGYALNVGEQVGAEKIEALMHFLAERYSDSGIGSIHSWIIGNEVNNNNDWHWSGGKSVTNFANDYADEVRLCYNAIKSVNANAKVYINLDQRWMWEDGTHDQYGGKKVLDAFNQRILSGGNINWGLSFHPHAVPLYNCKFWIVPSGYGHLVDNSSVSKMVTSTNMDVVVNYMMQPQFVSPAGTIRSIIVSELLFTSSNRSYATNEQIQAAAMTYGYKLLAAKPAIEAVVIHRDLDDASEIRQGMACGLRRPDGTPKASYEAFKYMDIPNAPQSAFALPIIGASSWAQLGVQ